MTWILASLLVITNAYAVPQQDGDAPAVVADQEGTDDDSLTPVQIEEVAALLRAGHLELARQTIDGFLVDRHVRTARKALAGGQVRNALEPLDAALRIDAEHVEALLLRARVALLAAPNDSSPAFFYDDAANFYERASRADYAANGKLGMVQYDCLLNSSIALRMANQGDKALEAARRANLLRDRLREQQAFDEVAGEQGPALERVWAEAAFGEYVAARNRGEEGTDLDRETQDKLELCTSRPADRVWALLQLSNLHQWAGRMEQSLDLAERALEFAPADLQAHARLAQLIGDNDAIAARYAQFRETHPNEPIGWWYGGSALFTSGLDAYESGTLLPDRFREAEALFQSCLDLEPAYAQDCKNQICLCRAARGWCHLFGEDLVAAQGAFESMEAVQPRGMTVELAGRISSGVVGLSQVAGAHHALVLTGDLEAGVQACGIADTLRRYEPTDANLANNAGFVYRDTAVAFEAAARSVRPGTDAADSAAFERLRRKAIELMDQSWEAYQRASALAPTDVRIVNDAGLIMLYYVRTDAREAERLLQQSVTNGEQQLQDLEDAGQTDVVLVEALGDAYENLGLLHMTLLPDLDKAKQHLERSLELGPYPRGIILQRLRPILERMLAGETVDEAEFDGIVWLHAPGR